MNSGFRDVSFGLDGKDIMTGSFPSNSLVMRNIWSSKMETEGMRDLAFNMQTGLLKESFEFYGPNRNSDTVLEQIQSLM